MITCYLFVLVAARDSIIKPAVASTISSSRHLKNQRVRCDGHGVADPFDAVAISI
jgi:hypothetical protein